MKINKDEIKNSNTGFDVIKLKYGYMYYYSIANDAGGFYSEWNKDSDLEIIKQNISKKESVAFAKSLNKLTGKL